MNRPPTLCDFDWQAVRMITVEGLTVRILDGDTEFMFEFGSAEELHAALQHWAGQTLPRRPHHAMPTAVTMSVHHPDSVPMAGE